MSRTKSGFFTLLTVALVAVFTTSVSFGGDTEFEGTDGTRWLTAEVGSADQVWQVPGASDIVRNLAFIPGSNNICFDLTPGNGATWDSAAPQITVSIDQTNSDAADYVDFDNLSQTLVNSAATLRACWDSGTNPITSFSAATIEMDDLSFKDVNNAAGTSAGISMTVETIDAFTTNELDDGGAADTVADYFKGETFFKAPTVTKTTATVDVNQDREGFVPDAPDTATQDLGAIIALKFSSVTLGPFNIDGTAFLATGGELNSVVAIFSDDAALGGITTFEATGWATAPDRVTLLTAGVFDTSARAVSITVTGDDTLETRTITVTFTFNIDQPGGGDKDFVVGVGITISTWDLNGCVLLAHWVQGNTDAPGIAGAGVFKSRLYVVNHTSSIGAVNVEVIEMDLSTGGTTGVSLGTTSAGAILDLRANGAMLIRMEDVLTDLGVTLPHLVNGGNLAAIATIRVSSCSGSYQTFDETTTASFFGTANMTRIQ